MPWGFGNAPDDPPVSAGGEVRPVLPQATELRCRFDLLAVGNAAAQAEHMRSPEGKALLADLCDALESGSLRIVQAEGPGRWRAQGWIKRALVQLSGAGALQPQPGSLPGTELDSLGWREDRPLECRVPSGSFLRRGTYLAPGAGVMPPSTMQAGAAVLEGAMIDSHVLLGSAVLVGRGAVVGCGSMLAGALMPEEALSIVLERGVVVGGNCGLYGPMVVGESASIYAGTVLRAAAGAFHLGRQAWLVPDTSGTLRLPAGCSVFMGVPPVSAFSDGVQRLSAMVAEG